MGTRKTAVKRVVKKAVAKKAVAGKAVSARAVSEVFSTQPQAASTVAVPRNAVLVLVNGREKGTVETTGRKLQEFAVEQAQNSGIRTFSVYVDGRKADTSEGNVAMSKFSKIEIVAKDQRG